ncbi:MAG: hypothetical protein KDA28_15770, partial [Phycisphaerales bacterium]|nr:hypothetical protein [Phycisphaerales bacterium]
AAAQVAGVLKMHEMIPHLINAQVSGQTGGNREGTGSLAWIMNATQVAFVSDLEPVVADSAVAFDPELSVVSQGTLLQVFDAVVVTYRTEVHTTLMGLAEDAWGRPAPRELGWDSGKWHDWYDDELVPHMERELADMEQAPTTDAPEVTTDPSNPG